MAKLLTAKEAAEYLSLSIYTIYKYTSHSEIPFVKVGTRVLFIQEQIDEWLASKQNVKNTV